MGLLLCTPVSFMWLSPWSVHIFMLCDIFVAILMLEKAQFWVDEQRLVTMVWCVSDVTVNDPAHTAVSERCSPWTERFSSVTSHWVFSQHAPAGACSHGRQHRLPTSGDVACRHCWGLIVLQYTPGRKLWTSLTIRVWLWWVKEKLKILVFGFSSEFFTCDTTSISVVTQQWYVFVLYSAVTTSWNWKCIVYSQRLSLPMEWGYAFRSVCFSVCLSVCLLDYWKSYERILVKCFGGMGHGPWTKWLDFGGCLNHDPGPEIF